MPRSQKLDKMIKRPYLESDGFSINMSPGWFLEKPSWQRSMTTATPPLLQHNFLCCPIDSSHVCFSGKASKKLSWAKNGGHAAIVCFHFRHSLLRGMQKFLESAPNCLLQFGVPSCLSLMSPATMSRGSRRDRRAMSILQPWVYANCNKITQTSQQSKG